MGPAGLGIGLATQQAIQNCGGPRCFDGVIPGGAFDTTGGSASVASAPHGSPQPAPTPGPMPLPTGPALGDLRTPPQTTACLLPAVRPGPEALPQTPVVLANPPQTVQGPVVLAAASELPIIKPGTSAWQKAVSDIKSPGKSKNYRVATQAQAEQLLKAGRGNDIPFMPTYTDEQYLRGYEVHPNEKHTQNAPDNDLPHLKWKDWSGGKRAGANGHIFFGEP